ncbi:MAG TPA: hypothetical protein VHB77_13945, partial [Planctomycetaceae bacterium]|nr:hypothetical protein [Planctomycetaceae bacterium]
DETAARECVLEKFGDPRRVARKLWQDAMWEKLMSQRVQMVASVLMLVTCAGMFWMTSKIADQGREMNAALLARLDQFSQQAPAPAVNPEWNPAVVQLVSESGGPLPEGFTVVLGCEQLNFKQQEQADASGRADFGLQRPGTYEVRVVTPSGDWSETIERPLRAGRPFDLKITCPTEPSEIQAPIVLNWPQTLDSPDLLLACQVEGNQRVINGLTWGWHSRQQFLLDRSGKIVPYSDGFQDLFPPDTSDIPVPNGQWPGVKPTVIATVKLEATTNRNATIGLPVQFSPVAKIALMKFQDAQPDQPVAVQIGQACEVPIELERGKAAHWTLTIPERFEPIPDDHREAALPHPAPAG